MKRLIISMLLVLGAIVLSAEMTLAQDIVKVAPKNCKVLLDSNKVRIVEVRLKPGEKLPMHSHPANIVYSFTGGKAKYTLPDGKVTERVTKGDEAVWSDAVTHSTENTAKTATRALVIELK